MAWVRIQDAALEFGFSPSGNSQFAPYIEDSTAYSWSDRGRAGWSVYPWVDDPITVRLTVVDYDQGGDSSAFYLINDNGQTVDPVPNVSSEPYNEFSPDVVEFVVPAYWGFGFMHADQYPWEQETYVLIEVWEEDPVELVANDDHAETEADQPVQINVLANDTYGDAPVQPEDLAGPPQILEQPANGTAVVNPDGTVTYTPAPGFIGTDSFAYEILPHSAPPEECVGIEFQGSAFEFRWQSADNLPDWFASWEPIEMVFEGYAVVTYVPDGNMWYIAEGSSYENVPLGSSGVGTFSQEGNTACLNWTVTAGT